MATVGPVNDDNVAGYTSAAQAAEPSLENASPSYFPPASTSSSTSYQQQQQWNYYPPDLASLPPYQQQHQQQLNYFPPDLASLPRYRQQQQQQQWNYFSPDLASLPPYQQEQQQQRNYFPPDLASLPPYQQEQQQHEYDPCPWPPEPEDAAWFHGYGDFGSNDKVGIDIDIDRLLAMQHNVPTLAVPFEQPAATLPPLPAAQMQTAAMEMQWNNNYHLQPAAMAMQGEHRSFESPWQATAATAPPVHAAPFSAVDGDRAVVPIDGDCAVVPVDAPPAVPAKRRRGRPRGSTAASKSKLAGTSRQKKKGPRRTNPVLTLTPTPVQGQPREQPTAASTSAIVIFQHHGELEHCGDKRKTPAEEALAAIFHAEAEEEEEVVYADTSPTGVRFRPSDAELIGFLKLKYLGRKMPVDFIKEFDVYSIHPDTIQEKYGNSVDGVWYVFTSRNRKYGFGGRPARSVEPAGVEKVGFWKSNTGETDISVDGVVIGTCNMLTFELGEQNGTSKPEHTDWKMKEYRIPKLQKQRDGVIMLLDPWVISKIFKGEGKKEGKKRGAGVKKRDGGSAKADDERVNATEASTAEGTTAGTEGGEGEEEDTAAAEIEDGSGEDITAGTEGGEEEQEDTAAAETEDGSGEDITAGTGNDREEDGAASRENEEERLDGVSEELDLCVEDYIVSPDEDVFFLTEDDGGDAASYGGISSDNLLE